MKQRQTPSQRQRLTARILALRGKKSFELIARQLGVTRNVVAGVCFRADHPPHCRVASSAGGSRNKLGTGFHGGGPHAAKTLPLGFARGQA